MSWTPILADLLAVTVRSGGSQLCSENKIITDVGMTTPSDRDRLGSTESTTATGGW
jgi:hypothetical protein